VQNGYVDRVPVERVKEFQTKLMDYLTTRKSGLLATIGKEKVLSDTLKAQLKEAVEEFEPAWKGSEAVTHGQPS